MVPESLVWFVWASAFLLPWAGLYIFAPANREAMLWDSIFTAPFGLTEPLFVPDYWNPPSLFKLAERTGFDIESIIFCFGIGGIVAVLCNVLNQQRFQPVAETERHRPHHKFHLWALATPFLAFPLLYALPWNPIYPAITTMMIGILSTSICRPDLIRKTWIGGLLFLFLYSVFLAGLEWTAPGYIERVWNLDDLSNISIAGVPIEELLFALAFGAYWSGVYEHFTWKQVVSET